MLKVTWMDRLGNIVGYLWTVGTAGVEDEQFGLVVGDQGSGAGTHACLISFEASLPKDPESSSFRDKNLVSCRTTVSEDHMTPNNRYMINAHEHSKKKYIKVLVSYNLCIISCYVYEQT